METPGERPPTRLRVVCQEGWDGARCHPQLAAGVQSAEQWCSSQSQPQPQLRYQQARLDVEAVERDKQRRIPRVEVPPEKKEENEEGTDEEHTHMEGEATSELGGPTDTTATEAVNESGAAKAKVVGGAGGR